MGHSDSIRGSDCNEIFALNQNASVRSAYNRYESRQKSSQLAMVLNDANVRGLDLGGPINPDFDFDFRTRIKSDAN